MAVNDGYLRSIPSDVDLDDGRLYDPTAADGGATINADLAAIEAQDVAAFAVVLVHVATFAATEAADVASFSAALVHTSALAAVEPQDVAAFSGSLVHVADLAATEQQDIAAFSADVLGTIDADLAATEAPDVAAFDATVLSDEQPADTHDGVGVALIQYKRPHKKVYDEINEYFDLGTAAEAEQAVDAIAEAAKATVSEADSRAARSGIAAMLDEQRNAELRALLALAQDEDDAEAVLVMLELA